MIGLTLLSVLAIGCAEGALASAAPVAEAAPAIVIAAAEETPEAAPSGIGDETLSASEDSAPPLVFADESDQAVADRMLSAIEAITTMSGDFTQVAPSGAISRGKFYLRRPGFLRFEYDAPSPLLIVANGGMVYVRDEALETTDSYPLGKTPLKFLLRKKVELGDAKVVAVDRGADSVAVTFASSEDETEGELSIVMDAPALALREWVVRDPQEGVTIVTLDKVAEGQPLANRLFAVPETETPFLKN